MSGELKPCPFCGGRARCEIGKMAFEDAEVSCDACAATTGNFDDGYGREDNTRLATSAWNTRTLPDEPEDVVIERVARSAYFDHVDQHGYPNGLPTWDDLPEKHPHLVAADREHWRSIARAALSAAKPVVSAESKTSNTSG